MARACDELAASGFRRTSQNFIGPCNAAANSSGRICIVRLSPPPLRGLSMTLQGTNRTYENVIQVLASRRGARHSDANELTDATSLATASAHEASDPRPTPSIVGMSEWLLQLGHDDSAINALRVIHVAGTKGKGSTCAFTESFLRAHGRRTGFPARTGMYTSPHLVNREERVRINSKPLDRESFTNYFFEVYDRMPQLACKYDRKKSVFERGPRSLQLYALFAFHVFIREGVDVAVVETHSGGEYDATSVVSEPVVTAVTSIGMDHVRMLGPTIANIAWHKGGIYKAGAVALSTLQDSTEAAAVLAERAAEKGETLTFVGVDSRLLFGDNGLMPEVQRKNASLAAAAARAWLARFEACLNDDDLHEGLKLWSWPGRFQMLRRQRCTWFLDAAHNAMSVPIAAEWFATSSVALKSTVVRCLVFSHISDERDATGVLEQLALALNTAHMDIQRVVFTTYDASKDERSPRRARDPQLFHVVWKKFFPLSTVWDEPTIQDAVRRIEEMTDDHSDDANHILVTGSQHLVGRALKLIDVNARHY